MLLNHTRWGTHRASKLIPLSLSFGLVGVAISTLLTSDARADTSPLWGLKGENFSPQGRLSDWSFAGYHSGEAPIPTPPVKASVKDFGAVGDGQTDDTDAFKRAIAATENGALLVPAGRYVLTDFLYIRKSNLVLRGEGPEKSVLVFAKSLEEVKPYPSATTTGQPTSEYSWAGGFIWVEGKPQGASLGLVKEKASRGDKEIVLAAPAAVAVGQKIEIRQQDKDDKSLIEALYTGQSDDISKIKGGRSSFVSRVVAVDGAKLTLERALRTDIDPKWSANVRIFDPSVREVGIENLGFEFKNTPYLGHFTEQGYNPLTFLGAADCWARNLRFFNADSGPFVRGNFITVQNIVYEADRTPDKGGNQGHHGFTLGDDTLLRDFDFRIKFIHDISVEGGSGSVAASGKGVDLCFDGHKRYPYDNLFTDIDLGKGTRMYASGGGAALGRHHGAWTTWWNIRAARPQQPPKADYGPDSMNFVGITTDQAPVLEMKGKWWEPLAAGGLQPANLYDAQLARRLRK